MKRSPVTSTLRDIGVSPVKSLGQNFLHDRNLARWIVDQAAITPEDCVFEIGPGLGALTEIILDNSARVLAIEKDGRLAAFLREKFNDRQLQVIHGDGLKFDARELYRQRRVKLIGNLPYYVSSQLLFRFVTYPSPISLWLLMLQKELAKRLSASPSTSDYGALTLQVQLKHRVEYLRTIPASVFIPKPEVDSAIVRITPRKPSDLPAIDFELFSALVRQGFSQRRKQLGKLIADLVPNWVHAADKLGIDPKVRAEAVSLERWVALTNYVRPIAPTKRDLAQQERFPIVNKRDEVIGEAPRAKVHGDNLLHRAVHVLIFNKNGEILLQKRTRWKDRHPLSWDSSAAGHVNPGEDYDDAAKRELKEELGITAAVERLGKVPAGERTDHEFICAYRGEHNGPIKTNAAEIEAVEWFPQDIVDDWITARPNEFATAFLECWRFYRQLPIKT